VALLLGVVYDAWTFGSQVPGPAFRVTVGDTIDFTIVNKALMPHSMDFHAAEIAPDRAYANVMPNDSLHFRFVPIHVPVGGGMIFDTHLVEPGVYPFVSHAFADATKGAVGMLKAGGR